MTDRRMAACLLIGAMVLHASLAGAQSANTGAIAGAVRDTTGAVLPGVTIEVASPALIEKIRKAVTDDKGEYKVVDLRPGTYSVTFTLPGFSVVKRDGIVLSTGFTAPANADLRVGGVEETITVTGASPVVDTQNVRTQNVLSREVLDSVPTSKSIQSFAALTLGVTMSATGAGSQDVGGNKGEAAVGLAIHNGRANDSKLQLDGMGFNHLYGQGGGSNRAFLMNEAIVQEVTLQTSGVAAESETGGIQLNYVPKDGGNTFSLYGSGKWTNDSLQSDNLGDDLRARGLTSASSIKRIYDAGIGVGGPIVKDKLWFFTAHRKWGSQEYQAGAYRNGSVTPLFYTPDLTRPSYVDFYMRDHAARLAWQAASRQKVGFFIDYQRGCQCNPLLSAITTEDATTDWKFLPYLAQGTWSFPATNRLLFEAGGTYSHNGFDFSLPEGVSPDQIGITDLATGITYSAPAGAAVISTGNGVDNQSNQANGRASMSYVTGSHALKAGFNWLRGWHHQDHTINQSLSYTFLNRVPASLTQFAAPFQSQERLKNLALFVQDQWTIQRLTLNVGVRYDHFDAYTVAIDLPASRFLPARHFDQVDDVPRWNDVSPRVGISYDLFGNSKTAVKAFVGRYVGAQGVALAEPNNPALALVTNTTRTWTDSNGNYVPDCDLLQTVANAECGALANAAFGRPFRNTFYSPDVLTGRGARPYNWQVSAVLQHELRSNVGLTVGYFRTSYGNFSVTANRAASASDFNSYCITAPSDARLPGGGGYQVCGIYDVSPAKFGQVNNLVDLNGAYGEHKERFNGVDVALNARFGKGALLTGGVSTGRTITDVCYLNNLPNVVPGSYVNGGAFPALTPRVADFCRITTPWSAMTQLKLAGSYPLPFATSVSATLQNLPGIPDNANYVATNAVIAPSLGRNLAAGAAGTATIPVLVPFTKFEDRLTQFDVRFTKILKVGNTRIQGMFDIYNLFNASTVLGVNATYGAAWLRPTAILGARLFKFGAQVDF